MPDSDEQSFLLQFARIRWRLDALDEWRDLSDRRIAVVESLVNDLRFTDAVADALVEKLNARRKLELTALQKLGAGAFAVVLVVAPVLLTKLLG